MKIWKNTNTLDGYDEGLFFTDNPSEAEILLLGSKALSLDDFPHAKGLFRAGIGKDNVPFAEAGKRGVIIRFPSAETVHLIYEETANFTCGLIFRMNYQDVGTLNPWRKYDRTELREKTLLVMGTGNIGRLVAAKMKSFLRVLTFDIKENLSDDLRSLITPADFISIHIPNTPENRSFFDRERLRIMKDGSVLINTARGAIVDESALFEEISQKRIKAAFDVFWNEPYTGILTRFHPDDFYMTPHVASTCMGFLKGCAADLRNLIKEIEHD